MELSKKIVVPIGFSEQSLIALDEAIIFGKTNMSTIILLSVIEENSLFSRLFSDDSKKDKKLQEELTSKLNELALRKEKESGLRIETMVAHGTIYEEISRVAELVNADLVVMGTNGRPSNFKKRMIGSNAYRTVSMTHAPVITTRGIRRLTKLENIIFPVVLDRQSKEKVGMALHYGRLFKAKITVVALPKKESELALLTKHLDQVTSFINEKGVKCERHVLPASGEKVTEKLLDFAYEQNGDMIMIMDEGETPDIAVNLIGSEVQETIYFSELPVMCITPRKGIYVGFSNW
jgi:nucleotide-binding universal stress UspA family protein